MKNVKHMIIAGIIFIFFLGVGFRMASQTELWTDECFSVVSSVLQTSFGDMWKGNIWEGNNSPLFYTLEKIQCNIFAYHAPQAWLQHRWGGWYPDSQIFLRILPVIYMASAFTILFYFFARHYSLFVGFYSLSIGLSTFIIWEHWFEARPYALWFLLTMTQIILLVHMLKSSQKKDKLWILLIINHVLLALTTMISSIQIVAAVITLLVFRNNEWRRNVLGAILPLAACLFYYSKATKFNFFFIDGPLALISANYSKDRLIILGIFILVLLWKFLKDKDRSFGLESKFLVFIGLMLGAFGLLLIKMKLNENHYNGFQISSRYFISLAPLSMVTTTLCSVYLIRAFKSRWMKVGVFLFLAIFLALRIGRTLKLI